MKRLAESEPSSPPLLNASLSGANTSVSAAAAQSSRRRFSWSRFAAVAAALLLVCLGGLGIYKGFDFSGSDGARALMESAADSAGEAGDAYAEDNGAGEEQSFFGGRGVEICALPGEDYFPAASAAGFTLAETVVLETKSGAGAAAAVYTRGSDSLLWLKTDNQAAGDFTGTLAEMLATAVELTGTDGSLTRLEIGGRPALSWESEGSRLLIWDLSRTLTETGLRSLLD